MKLFYFGPVLRFFWKTVQHFGKKVEICGLWSVKSQRLLFRLYIFPRSLCGITYSRVQPQTALITTDQGAINTHGSSEARFCINTLLIGAILTNGMSVDSNE